MVLTKKPYSSGEGGQGEGGGGYDGGASKKTKALARTAEATTRARRLSLPVAAVASVVAEDALRRVCHGMGRRLYILSVAPRLVSTRVASTAGARRGSGLPVEDGYNRDNDTSSRITTKRLRSR
ncbi:hypothetical protein PR003_g29095 [Phytophthora rubi]|uniref:Uncharacterized protein n=1 Tax=Phytophthora rubi TaxID=129364 RepID=A0A6A4BTJ9_9STRA|nr:hypothetical protein PR003_g29095 [Phytophthora rubi]